MTPHPDILPLFYTCICGNSDCKVPYGECHCGCGQKTSIAKSSNANRRAVKGCPRMFVHPHSMHCPRPKPRPEGLCVCLDPTCDVPFGYCHCNCGRKTSISKRSHGKRIQLGDPALFLKWHRRFSQRINLDNAAPFKINGVYCRLISLTRGQLTIVDSTDYEWLTQWIWQAHKSPDSTNYACRGGNISMHMQILGLKMGSGKIGDHINGNSLDNRRANLRIVTKAENAMNRIRQKNNNTGCTGVRLEKSGKYSATIVAYNVTVRLGRFDSFEAAKNARLAAEKEHHGEFSSRKRNT